MKIENTTVGSQFYTVVTVSVSLNSDSTIDLPKFIACHGHLWQTKCSLCQSALLSAAAQAGGLSTLTSNRHHLSYDDCLENKGRLQDCSCSIGSYHAFSAMHTYYEQRPRRPVLPRLYQLTPTSCYQLSECVDSDRGHKLTSRDSNVWRNCPMLIACSWAVTKVARYKWHLLKRSLLAPLLRPKTESHCS